MRLLSVELGQTAYGYVTQRITRPIKSPEDRPNILEAGRWRKYMSQKHQRRGNLDRFSWLLGRCAIGAQRHYLQLEVTRRVNQPFQSQAQIDEERCDLVADEESTAVKQSRM